MLRAAGHDVLTSDLVNYRVRDQQARWDFLLEQRAPPGLTLILSNPPYKIAAEIVDHALTLPDRNLPAAMLRATCQAFTGQQENSAVSASAVTLSILP